MERALYGASGGEGSLTSLLRNGWRMPPKNLATRKSPEKCNWKHQVLLPVASGLLADRSLTGNQAICGLPINTQGITNEYTRGGLFDML